MHLTLSITPPKHLTQSLMATVLPCTPIHNTTSHVCHAHFLLQAYANRFPQPPKFPPNISLQAHTSFTGPSLRRPHLPSFTLHTFTIKLLSQQTIYQTANLPYFITFHFQYIAWLTLSFYHFSYYKYLTCIFLKLAFMLILTNSVPFQSKI